jgi:uncharacterized protein (DUF362 family)
MSSPVSLVKAKSGVPCKEDVAKALQLIDFKAPANINTVSIKSNLCYYWNASTGQTTDPLLVGAIIDYLRETYGKDLDITIAEADASAMQTKIAFKLLGYEKLAKEKNVQLLNLSVDKIQDVEVQVNGRKLELKVPESLMKSDLFINVPKLKVMRQVHLTCAMKNLFGAIAFPRKVIYHHTLEDTIVGINKILKPHLNIVDGYVALASCPVRLNLLMAGTSAYSVDYVAAKVMGYQPSKVKFLNLAAKEKLGEPKNVVIKGEKPETFSKNFPVESNLMARVKMGAQFSLIKVYSKVSGDVIPPVIEDN